MGHRYQKSTSKVFTAAGKAVLFNDADTFYGKSPSQCQPLKNKNFVSSDKLHSKREDAVTGFVAELR